MILGSRCLIICINSRAESPSADHYCMVSISEPTDAQFILVRNPYYWKVDTEGNQLPYIDRLTFEYIQDASMVEMRTSQVKLISKAGTLVIFPSCWKTGKR